MSRRRMKAVAAAAASGAMVCSAQAALVGQWKADTYTSGNWVDSTGNGHDATPVGTLTTTANAFNGHAGINFPGGNGATASGFFKVTNDTNTLVGAPALTLVAVFNPTAAGTSVGGQFWQKSGLIGNEQPGAVNDWGMGFAGGVADAGIGAPDTTILSGNLALNQTHVAIETWDSTGTLTLYVDGAQAAQMTTTATAPRDNNQFGAFALGADVAAQNGDLHIFTGQIAELRVYNDNSQDIAALTTSLQATYGVPEPASLGLLSLGGIGLLTRRRRC